MVVRVRCFHCGQEETLRFLSHWRELAIKALVTQVCSAKWTAYGEALKRVMAGKVSTGILYVSALNLNYDV